MLLLYLGNYGKIELTIMATHVLVDFELFFKVFVDILYARQLLFQASKIKPNVRIKGKHILDNCISEQSIILLLISFYKSITNSYEVRLVDCAVWIVEHLSFATCAHLKEHHAYTKDIMFHHIDSF